MMHYIFIVFIFGAHFLNICNCSQCACINSSVGRCISFSYKSNRVFPPPSAPPYISQFNVENHILGCVVMYFALFCIFLLLYNYVLGGNGPIFDTHLRIFFLNVIIFYVENHILRISFVNFCIHLIFYLLYFFCLCFVFFSLCIITYCYLFAQ